MKWVVTGANRGIGLALVAELMERGESVVAGCRSPEQAGALSQTGAEVRALDVTSEESVAAFAGGLSPVDVLINNAGTMIGDAIGEFDFPALQRVLDVNSVGPLRILDALMPALRAGERKFVANISSQMGSIEDNSSGGYYAYRMSKAALNMAVKSAAVDLRSEGVTVVSFCPGWVQTDMGGSGASITPRQSARALVDSINAMDLAHSGGFYTRRGKPIPW